MEPLTIALIVIGVILLLRLLGVICGGSTPEAIGDIGESRTAYYLHKLPTDTYTVFNDVIVTDSEGRTTQIDHIVVSRYGIFVVETKCYKGWIFGNEPGRCHPCRLHLKRLLTRRSRRDCGRIAVPDIQSGVRRSPSVDRGRN